MNSRIGFDLVVGLTLRGLGAASGFVLFWLIAQLGGAPTVGAYQMGLTTASTIALLAVAGQDVLIIREAPQIARGGSLADLRTHYVAGRRFAMLSGAAGAALMLLGVWVASLLITDLEPWVALLLAFAPVVPMMAVLRHSTALLRCQGNVLLSQSLEGLVYTSLAAVMIASLWLSDQTVTPVFLPLAYLAGLVLATGVALFAANRMSTSWKESGEGRASLDIPAGLRITGAPFLTQAGEWLTLIALGALAGLSDAGIYRTAFTICLLFQLVSTSFATMAGPHMARASAESDRAGLFSITTKVGLIGSALVAPLAALCVIVPEWLLGLFGDEFKAGALTLQIVAVTQLFNVAVRPVIPALVMVGREKLVLGIEVVATSFGVLLAVVLIPSMGMLGAAIGFACATVLRNLSALISLIRWHPDIAEAMQT